MTEEGINKMVKARDETFEADDMSIVEAVIWPEPRTRHYIEKLFHKARYEAIGVSPEKRTESAVWLSRANATRIGGGPLLPEGELPT